MEDNKFDMQLHFQDKIENKLRELMQLCAAANIPCFFAAAVAEDGDDTTYVHKMISPLVANRVLSDDRISRCVKVVQGYIVVSPDEAIINIQEETF